MKSWTLVGVPVEGGALTTGARAAHAVITKYFKSACPNVLELFAQVTDLDDDRWRFIDRSGVINGFAKITNELQGGVLAIGGCHTITYYAVQALRRQYPELALVIFDAHSDAS